MRVTSLFLLPVFVGLAGSTPFQAIQAEPFTLKLKFEPGRSDKATVITNLAQTFTSEFLEEPVRQTMTQTVEAATLMRRGAGDEFLWDFQLRNIRLKSDIDDPPKDIDFEAMEATPGPVGEAIRAVRAAKFTFHMTPEGKILKVTGFDDLITRFQDLGAPDYVIEQMRDQLNEDELKEMFGGGFSGLVTGKALRQGDSWQHEQDMNIPEIGESRLSVTYTFAGYEVRDGRKLARISWRTVGKIVKPDSSDPNTKVDVKSLKQMGYLYFDIEAGWVIEQFLEQTMQAIVTVTEEGETLRLPCTQRMRVKAFLKLGAGKVAA